MSDESRRLGLEADVDIRLTELWTVIWEPGSRLDAAMCEDEELGILIGRVVRYCYSRGYADALHEDAAGRRGELATTHGYRID
jgi:hypothetical protein